MWKRDAADASHRRSLSELAAGWGRRARDLRDRLLESHVFWLLAFAVLGTLVLAPGRAFDGLDLEAWQQGQIAAQDYVAPRDLPIEEPETTAERRRKAREEVLPVYDFDPGLAAELEARVAELFSTGRGLVEAGAGVPTPEELEAALPSVLRGAGALRRPTAAVELFANRRFSADLADRLGGVLGEVLRRGVVLNKNLLLEQRERGITLLDVRSGREQRHLDLYEHLGYPDELADHIGSQVRAWPGFSSRERRVLVEFLVANVTPNLNANLNQTRSRQEAAAAGAQPVFVQIKQGQVLVRKGDQISAAAARAIAAFARGAEPGSRLPALLGSLLLVLFGALVLWVGCKREKVADHSRQRRFNEGLIVLLLGLVGARFALLLGRGLAAIMADPPFQAAESYAYAVPFAAVALLARLLYTRGIAVLLSLVYAVLVSVLVADMVPGAPSNFGGWTLIYCLAGSTVALWALDTIPVTQRLVLTRVGALIGGANAILILIIAGLSPAVGESGGIAQLGFDLLCGALGGLVVAGAVNFALPMLESLLCLTSDIKLVELSNTNLPLLRRLAFEAPGSFQHSLMVANLAKAGCEAIDADAVLAYAGGLYHDVGKIERPEYFIENQKPGHNPHDKLQPSMSALVIVNHVKVGLALAREHNLPQQLRDAVAQHHGTRKLTFFYNKALEKKGGEPVREEDYRYPGPRPRNKVMGILMLADATEAASRSLDDVSDGKIRSVIEKIIDDCLHDGQLDNCDLTLADLAKVAEAFQRILSNIYHRRVEYPGFDFNQKPKKESRTLTVAADPESSRTARAS